MQDNQENKTEPEVITLNLGKLKTPIYYNHEDNTSYHIHHNGAKSVECNESIEIKDLSELPQKATELGDINNKKLSMALKMKKEYYIKTIIKK